MRELKFRAWDDLSKTYRGHTDPLTIQMLIFRQHLDRGILEQYTGLNDKNGREIYDGDIVRVFGGFGCEWKSRIAHIESRMGGFFVVKSEISFLLDDHDAQYEIIGNIHESSELLKGAQ